MFNTLLALVADWHKRIRQRHYPLRAICFIGLTACVAASGFVCKKQHYLSLALIQQHIFKLIPIDNAYADNTVPANAQLKLELSNLWLQAKLKKDALNITYSPKGYLRINARNIHWPSLKHFFNAVEQQGISIHYFLVKANEVGDSVDVEADFGYDEGS